MESKKEKRQENQHLSLMSLKSSESTHKGFSPREEKYRREWKST